MTYILRLTYSLVLWTTLACNGTSPMEGSQTYVTSPILGGMPTSPADSIGRSTVQIMSFNVQQHRDGTDHVLDTSTCTGTIISSNLILTAAHCVIPKARQTWVFFSTQLPYNYQDVLLNAKMNSRMRQVVNAAVSSNWKPAGKDFESPWHDIAILKIAGTIPDNAAIARLLPPYTTLSANETVLTAGYGVTNPVEATDEGNLQQVLLTIANPQFKTGEFLVSSKQQLGVCQGDSGGPAYVRREGRWFVAGITSHPVLKPGQASQMCHVSTIFTDVSYFSDWVHNTAVLLKNTKKSGLIVN